MGAHMHSVAIISNQDAEVTQLFWRRGGLRGVRRLSSTLEMPNNSKAT